MTWKERRTVTILLSIVGALFLALLIVFGMIYREGREEALAGTAAPAGLSADGKAVDPGAYTALRWYNGSATLSFALDEEGKWIWADGPDFPLNADIVTGILKTLSELKFQQTLPATEGKESYGLDSPSATLTAASGEKSQTLVFGKTTTDGASRYVMEQSDPSKVYIIPDTLFTQMSIPIYDMCDVPLLPLLEESSIRSILIRGSESEDGAPALVTILTTAKRSGDDGPVTWLQGSENITSNETVRALLEDLRTLSLTKCVDYDPSDEAASICGFDAPPAALTVNYASPTGTEESLTLTVGNTVLDGSGRYVRLDGSSTIYSLPTAALDPLMRVAVNGLDMTE